MKAQLYRAVGVGLMLLGAAVLGPSARVQAQAGSAGGTLTVHIVFDGSMGTIHVVVRKAASQGKGPLAEGDVTATQDFDKTFSNLKTDPIDWYVVQLSWKQSEYHNMSDGTSIISVGLPVHGQDNLIRSWQAAGYGVVASIPVRFR